MDHNERMALVVRAQGMSPYEIADLIVTARKLAQWQIRACQLAQTGQLDKLADHLMLPNPTVSPGQYIRLVDEGEFYKVIEVTKDGGITMEGGATCNVTNVYEVVDEI